MGLTDPDPEPGDDRRIALAARDWIVRLSSGDVTDEDLRRFRTWQAISPTHRAAFERERAFWSDLSGLDASAPLPPSPGPAHNHLPRRIGRRALLVGGGSIAAGALLAPRLADLWSADIVTAAGEQREAVLPDGSTASLNTDTALAVSYGPELRLVRLLKGEAEFHARPGPLFRVAAAGGNSDLLGRGASVRLFGREAIVTATAGDVRVASPAAPDTVAFDDTAAIMLSEAQQTRYTQGSGPRSAAAVDTAATLAWRRGRIVIEGLPFAGAMAELGRYLPERIILVPGVDAEARVSGIFSTSGALSAVLALARTQGLSARRLPGVAILIS